MNMYTVFTWIKSEHSFTVTISLTKHTQSTIQSYGSHYETPCNSSLTNILINIAVTLSNYVFNQTHSWLRIGSCAFTCKNNQWGRSVTVTLSVWQAILKKHLPFITGHLDREITHFLGMQNRKSYLKVISKIWRTVHENANNSVLNETESLRRNLLLPAFGLWRFQVLSAPSNTEF